MKSGGGRGGYQRGGYRGRGGYTPKESDF